METNFHWKYFLALDEDFGRLARYIEPCENNFTAYSIELARLLMMGTQECDVILKEICCKHGNPECSKEKHYRDFLSENIPGITSCQVECLPYGLNFTPFESWKNNETPDWWKANNKVKHERKEHFDKANLRNVMNTLSALLLVNFIVSASPGEPRVIVALGPSSKNFTPKLNVALAQMKSDFGYNLTSLLRKTKS